MADQGHTKQEEFSLAEMIETIDRLSREISRSHTVGTIVFIHRGGMVPARYFAKHLDVRRVYGMGLESYTDRQRGEISIYQELPPTLALRGTVLIVDDIVDSGSSLRAAVEHVKERGAEEIATCALHRKTDCSIQPDFCGHVVESDVWVAYDWE